MKQKDFALIAVIVFLSGIISLFLTKIIIAPPTNRQEQVEVVEPIKADFTPPSEKYFNAKSIDPTQIIKIGENNNNQPFNNKQ